MPLDQLARFIEVDFGRAMSVMQGLEEAGCIEHRRFLVKDYPWFWSSWRGLQFAATGFQPSAPVVSSLAHRRGIHEVCLYLRARAPQGTWICERKVKRIRDPLDHLPDAVFEIEVNERRERHAIEVELSRKGPEEILEILSEHSDRYDAVVYFCAPKTHRFMSRVKESGHWPKLVIRHLSEACDETVP